MLGHFSLSKTAIFCKVAPHKKSETCVFSAGKFYRPKRRLPCAASGSYNYNTNNAVGADRELAFFKIDNFF